MIKLTIAAEAHKISLVGHGLAVDEPFQLSKGIVVRSDVPPLNEQDFLHLCETDRERAVVSTMHEMADFVIEVTDNGSGVNLVNQGWNCLWDFHLLSLAAKSPAVMLYAVSSGGLPYISVVNRNHFFNSVGTAAVISPEDAQWSSESYQKFRALIGDPKFAASMRYYGNSHYLFDLDARLMLLWAGIEGLLDVDGEMNRRLALYAAILHEGSKEEKFAYFQKVKKAYSVRSRVVHGTKPNPEKLESAYKDGSEILARLLRRCVGLGRVPQAAELDRVAVAQYLL